MMGDRDVILQWLIKMFNKKASLPGWTYVVALIIGILVLVLIIWMVTKSGSTTKGYLDIVKNLL